MSIVPFSGQVGSDDPNDHPLVRLAKLIEEKAHQDVMSAIAFAELEKRVVTNESKIQEVDAKADKALQIQSRADLFVTIIPVLEGLKVRIPDNMKGVIGAECKQIAIELGDNPEARGKEQIGQYPTWTYPRGLVLPIARRWIIRNQHRPDRAFMFNR